MRGSLKNNLPPSVKDFRSGIRGIAAVYRPFRWCVALCVLVGLVNVAEQGSGIQIGLVNYGNVYRGLQIGAANVIAASSCKFMPVVNFAF